VDTLGAGVVLAGTVAWSSGSIYSRSLARWRSGLKTSGVQMMCGGLAVALVALIAGELGAGTLNDVSLSSLFSLVYLILFGSVVGYSAYMYLLGVTSAARVSTYAFVNPVVAVLLGALFAGEHLTSRVLAAGALIVTAVALITFFGGDAKRPHTKHVSAPVREAP
jgi:drug/metabolite transporter (DMT)-like permease